MRSTYWILLLVLLFACQSKEETKENKTFAPNIQQNNNIVMVSGSDTIITSKPNANNKTLITSTVKNSLMKNEKLVDQPAEVSYNNEDNYIIPGTTRNTFTQNNRLITFQSLITKMEDSRVGCSDGSEDISFSVESAKDTFYFENGQLQMFNFKYSATGGLGWYAEGKNPYKGVIKGKLLPDSSWLVEIDVWLKTKDMMNQETERQIKFKRIFNR